MTSRFCLPGHYLVLEGSPTSASNLEWFVTEFLSAEKEKAEAADGSVYDLCNELVAGTTPDESSLVFLPFLYGSHASPDAKGSLLGLNGWHTRAHVLRALYEGVVFGHKHHVDLLLRFRAAPAAIRLTGGATHSEVWTQLFADCFQTPIEVPDGDELGALGAAICAGVACGAHPGYTEAIDAMVHFSRRVEPETSKAEVYETKYRRYQRAIEALDPVWGELG